MPAFPQPVRSSHVSRPVDTLFQQLRRLQAKEDEISARAQDLVTKEKNLRAGKLSDDGSEAKKQAEELQRKEEELRRREEKLEADAAARAASLEARGHICLSLRTREPVLKECEC